MSQSFNAALLTKPQGLYINPFSATQFSTQVKSLMSKGAPVIASAALSPAAEYTDTFIDTAGGPFVHQFLKELPAGAGSVLVLGLTFKENVPDLRNSRCFDLVRRLQWLGHEVEVADPIAPAEEIEREHGLTVTGTGTRRYDLVVGAVAHDQYRQLTDDQLAGLLAPQGTLADLKGTWRDRLLDPALDRWTL